MTDILPLAPQDAEALAALHAAVCGARSWSAESLLSSLAQSWGLKYIADGAVIGFVLCRQADDVAEILTFAVHPDRQGRGHGRALLQAARAAAQQRGSRKMFLEVAADNQAALGLYKAAGFRQTGLRRGYYARPGGAVDAVLMEGEVDSQYSGEIIT